MLKAACSSHFHRHIRLLSSFFAFVACRTGLDRNAHRTEQVINEEIKDLIGATTAGTAAAGLALRENAQGEVTVAGLSKHEVIPRLTCLAHTQTRSYVCFLALAHRGPQLKLRLCTAAAALEAVLAGKIPYARTSRPR